MTTNEYAEIEAELRQARKDWERRLTAIQSDRRRESAPLDKDWEDQATQRENDATLDALDEKGRRELVAIDAALERIAAGTYGRCADCSESIAINRLRAYPSALSCARCARGESADDA
jgi:RNA polymerase-binding transcription factor DksA